MKIWKGKEWTVFICVSTVLIIFSCEFGIKNQLGPDLKFIHGIEKDKNTIVQWNSIGNDTSWGEEQKGRQLDLFFTFIRNLLCYKCNRYFQITLFLLGALIFQAKKSTWKSLSIFILLMIVPYSVIGTYVGYNIIGGTKDDVGYSIIKTMNGDYLITGHSNSGGAGNNDVLLMRVNSSFSLISIQYFGGKNNDIGRCICNTSNTGSAIAGYTNSYGPGHQDAYVLRFDSNDNLIFSNNYGGTNYRYAFGLKGLSNGNLIIVGIFGTRSWILILDSENNQIFSKIIGTTSNSEFLAVDTLRNENIIVAGALYQNNYQAYIAKFNSSGSMLWEKQYGSSLYSTYLYSVVVGPNSNFFACGFSHINSSTGYFLMTDSEGIELWSINENCQNLYCRSVANLPNGNYAATGYTGYTTSGNVGGNDGWVIKLTYEGTILFRSFFGGTGTDYIYGLVGESDGGYTVVGSSSSFSASGYNVYIKGGYFGCEPGSYNFSNSCTYCPAGTYNPYCGGTSLSSCSVCSAGTYSSLGSTNCTSCPAGTYNPNHGGTSLSSCTVCSAGTYSSLGSINCTSCPAGTYNPNHGGTSLSSCIVCSAGTYSSLGSTNCTSCPAGTYNPNHGGTSLSSCIVCRAGTYSTLGSSNCTFCPADTYNVNKESTSLIACLPCPPKMTSSQGSAFCNCKKEYVFRRNECLLKNLGLQNCNLLKDCVDNNSTRATCDGTCKCNTGFFWSDTKELCVPPMDGTYFCNNNSNCTYFADNVQCNGFCICVSSYIWSKSHNRCLAENIGKLFCTSIDDCTDNGYFSRCDGNCTCLKGFAYNTEEKKCKIILGKSYNKIYILVVIFCFLTVLIVWSILKDKVESVENNNIESLAKKEYRIYCQNFEQNISQIDNNNKGIEFAEYEDIRKKADEKKKKDEKDELLFWGRFELEVILINTFIRSHELIKVFLFSSPIISRNARAIIFSLQMQAAFSSLVFFTIVLCPNSSSIWQILSSFFSTLPIKWLIEFLLRFSCDTRIGQRLVKPNVFEEIQRILTGRLKTQCIIRGIGKYTGYFLICIFLFISIYLLYVVDYQNENSIDKNFLYLFTYHLIIHQCLVGLFQFILIRIYGPSYTCTDFYYSSYMKSLIKREIIEGLFSLL